MVEIYRYVQTDGRDIQTYRPMETSASNGDITSIGVRLTTAAVSVPE